MKFFNENSRKKFFNTAKLPFLLVKIKIGKKKKAQTSFCSQHLATCRQHSMPKMDVWSVQLFDLPRQQKATEDLEENTAPATALEFALAFAFASTGRANILRTQVWLSKQPKAPFQVPSLALSFELAHRPSTNNSLFLFCFFVC